MIELTEELNRLSNIEKKYNEQFIQNEILKKFLAFLKVNEKRSASKPLRLRERIILYLPFVKH
ncbi:hypothetical protein PB01_14060 [Psychrobacillus glaciei]|uniref:Uncharacterized protein n=1 Tax=Psychrobacillus glaciei TaxID=2283160 RepID=A0A5J6SPF8_9BACI|nr:hypothetical protein PB01_14060 [Psychrobacillus glaciei]